MNSLDLVKTAEKAMKKAYAPYSRFFVGAALLCTDGTVYTGCNIENASFSPTICAERTAIFTAISDGHRDFEMIAIVGGRDGVADSFVYPCGVCRQVMREFCPDSFRLVLYDGKNISETTLGALLPCSFSKDNIKE